MSRATAISTDSEIQVRFFRIILYCDSDESCRKALDTSFGRLTHVNPSIFSTIILDPSTLASNIFDAEINDLVKQGKTILHLAAMKGFASTLELLISKGANINCSTSPASSEITPLLLACDSGEIDVVKLLLIHGAIFDIRCARSLVSAEKDFFTWSVFKATSSTGEAYNNIVKMLEIFLTEFEESKKYVMGSPELQEQIILLPELRGCCSEIFERYEE